MFIKIKPIYCLPLHPAMVLLKKVKEKMESSTHHFLFFIIIYDRIGKATHASGAPWEGINALDAVVSMYNNVSVMRQQIKMTDRIHCVISKGGERPNIIPDKTEIWYQIRSKTSQDFKYLRGKLMACAEAAKTATGKQN